MTKLYRFFPIVLCIALASTAQAQLPEVDIRLVDSGNGEVEVRVRPDGTFDGLFSSIVFTVRWETSTNATLGTGQQVIPALIYMPVSVSGPTRDSLGYRYQIYAGFGFNTLQSQGVTWQPNTEYTLMTIPIVNGTQGQLFEIVNDPFTAAYNGDYYVSLNGVDKTGGIYSGSTSINSIGARSPGLSIMPNPATDNVMVSVSLLERNNGRLVLMNSLGQVVRSEDLRGAIGRSTRTWDLSGLAPGVYVVELQGEQVLTEKLVVR